MINKSDLPKFNPDIYTKIILNDLVVFSIHYLHSKNTEVTSEDIISACFMLFPKRFSLRNHPHWPDSAMVSRHWSVCRSKGYIAAGAEPGFKLTAKGVRLAEKVAKGLGVATPKRASKAKPSWPKVRAEKITKPSAVKRVQHPGLKAHDVMLAQKAKIVQEEKITPPAPIKKAHPIRSKRISSSKKEKVVLRLAVRKTRSSRSKLHAVTQAKTTQSVPTKKVTPSKPIKNVRPIWTEKTKPPEPVVRSIVVEKVQVTQPEKTIRLAQNNVTREVKVRAGKYVRAIETSDAYILYKKNGKNSKISEFDFRSLLLCTMESSPETLARNVEQFKGYASIHNRHDLVAFLSYCEDKLSYLLAPQINRSTKPTRRTMK